MKLFDEEIYEYYVLEMVNADDVAENGRQAKFKRSLHDELPSPEFIAGKVKRAGFDTFEVTHIKETIKRFQV